MFQSRPCASQQCSSGARQPVERARARQVVKALKAGAQGALKAGTQGHAPDVNATASGESQCQSVPKKKSLASRGSKFILATSDASLRERGAFGIFGCVVVGLL